MNYAPPTMLAPRGEMSPALAATLGATRGPSDAVGLEPATLFTLGDTNRTVADWRRAGSLSAEGNAKRYAREHGAAGMWRADDSLRVYYLERGRVHQRTFAPAVPTRYPSRLAQTTDATMIADPGWRVVPWWELELWTPQPGRGAATRGQAAALAAVALSLWFWIR